MNKAVRKIAFYAHLIRLRLAHRPNRGFIRLMRRAFMDEFNLRHQYNRAAASRAAPIARYAIAAALLLIVLHGSVVIYADRSNVDVKSPLYGLKREGESIHLALSSGQNKAKLKAVYAERRLKEIEETQSDFNANSDLVRDLYDDLESKLSSLSNQIRIIESGANRPTPEICEPTVKLIERYQRISAYDTPSFIGVKNKCGEAFGL